MTKLSKTRFQRNAAVPLVEFLRPNGLDPRVVSVEQAFQVFRYLIASAIGYTAQHSWHTSSAIGLMGGSYAGISSQSRPITGIRDLLSRFHLAVFHSGATEVEAWRSEHEIHAYSLVNLSEWHYRPNAAVPQLGFSGEMEIREKLNFLLKESAGKMTSVALNCIHHSARVIHDVGVQVSPTGFTFSLNYGFKSRESMKTEGDSEWRYVLSTTRKLSSPHQKQDEPFLDTFRRALDNFDFITSEENSHLMLNMNGTQFVAKPVEESLNLLAA